MFSVLGLAPKCHLVRDQHAALFYISSKPSTLSYPATYFLNFQRAVGNRFLGNWWRFFLCQDAGYNWFRFALVLLLSILLVISFRVMRRFLWTVLLDASITTDLGISWHFTVEPSVCRSGMQPRSPGDSFSPNTTLCLWSYRKLVPSSPCTSFLFCTTHHSPAF